jgi:hypothetical protein
MARLRVAKLLVPAIAALPPAAMPLGTPPKIRRLRPKLRTSAWAVVIPSLSPLWKEDKLSSIWDPAQDLIVSWRLVQSDQLEK